MIRRFVVPLAATFLFTLVPSIALAQSTLLGVVKDPSGAVLPGVTIEASSDVLIEKVKTAITDSEGQYRIVDLRPGTYTITFTLPGFNTFRREGVLLPAEFTATINAELTVGNLAETVTVTGESPIVDVSSAAHTAVLDRELIDALPTGRTIQGMGQLVVGVNLNLPDTGGARGMQQTYMSTHGMSTANTSVLVDGMMVNGLQADGAVQSYFNDAMNAEVSYQTSAIGAETSSGGVRLNMIPREGGNRWSGDFKMAFRPGDWQSSNLTDRHQARGLSAGNAVDRIIDYTVSMGGPIRKDKLWLFGTTRYYSVNNFIANTFFDDGGQGIDDQYIFSGLARLTWQVTPRNKISAYFDEIDKYRGHDMQSNYDPETAATVWNSPAYHTTGVKWTSPVTSALFLEAGWSSNLEYYTNEYRDGIEKPRGTAEWFATAARNELDLGGYTIAGPTFITQSPAAYYWNAAATYVKGDHTLKIGANMRWGNFIHTRDANADLVQQYRSSRTGVRWSVPDSVLIRNTPLRSGERLNRDLGLYVQDSWRLNRLTANLGIRWETLKAQILPGASPAGRFVPAREFAGVENLPDWNDFAPRMSLVYDLFGTGRTALKYSLNRYNLSRTTGIAENYNPLRSETASLPWQDVNGDNIAQGERECTTYPSVGCEISFAGLPPNFGTAALNEYGNYPRTWNLESGVELQHELLSGLSIGASWWRGSFRNLTTTVNQSWSQSDYSPYTWHNPITGEPFTVYARSLDAASRPTRNLDTYDPERRDVYEALNFEGRWRIPGGGQLLGGFGIERERFKACTAPDDPNYLSTSTNPAYYNGEGLCDEFKLDIPWRPGFKMSGSRELFYGINLSFVFQNNSSPTSSRIMTVTRGQTRYPTTCPAPCPAGQIIMPTGIFGQPSLTYNLESLRATAVERIVQLDFKVSKTFRMGTFSVIPSLEVFNVNNSDAIISYVTTNVLSSNFLAPNSIMQGRMIGFGLQTRW